MSDCVTPATLGRGTNSVKSSSRTSTEVSSDSPSARRPIAFVPSPPRGERRSNVAPAHAASTHFGSFIGATTSRAPKNPCSRASVSFAGRPVSVVVAPDLATASTRIR